MTRNLQPRGLVTKTTEPFVMPKKKGKSGVLNLGAKKPEVASPTDNNNNNNNNNTPVTPNEETPAIASPITPTDPNNNNNNNNNQTRKKPPTEVQNTLKSPEILREELRREILKKKSGKDYIRDPRPHYSIVFCGHVDAGKSTLSGRLLHSFGLVDEREMDKIKREAAVNKREGWEYAYVLDVSEEERAKGKTHEVGAAYFETEKRRITILDAPGHKAFVPSMIGGAMQAEVAIMVISARTGEFETGFEKGGQTREHTMLVRTCGVKHLICVVNKMDETSEGGGGSGQWNKDRFDEIMGKLRPFFKSNGYDENNNNNGDSSSSLIVIPVASLAGQNLTSRVTDDICPWYNGPSLIEAINNLKLVDTRREDDVLAVPIVGAVKDDGKMIISGKCESGSIEIGEKLQILPSKQEITVEGILIENTELDKCYPGDNIQLKVKGINDDSEIKGGYVITSIPTSLKASEFIQARVVVLDVKNILSAGSRLMMHIHTAQEEVIIDKILATIDKKTGAVLEKEPSCVKAGCTIMVRLELERALVVDTHTSFDKMARFMLRSEGKTVALGLVTRLYESTKDKIKRGN